MPAFVEALEACIRDMAARISEAAPQWADHCQSPGAKTHWQAAKLVEWGVLEPFFDQWGYGPTLW